MFNDLTAVYRSAFERLKPTLSSKFGAAAFANSHNMILVSDWEVIWIPANPSIEVANKRIRFPLQVVAVHAHALFHLVFIIIQR